MKYTHWFAENGKLEAHEQWIRDNLILETCVGSRAYACENPDSDYDIIGVVMPKREHIFPQEFGYILNFDQVPAFRRKEIKKSSGGVTIIGDKEVEIEWISLVEFFYLVGLKGSPNLTESLFVKPNMITYANNIDHRLRDNRRLFLSMKTYISLRGYAVSQYHKLLKGKPLSDERQKLINEFGYDIKFAYHMLRLIDQMYQLLTLGDIDLTRNKEEHKSMKRGEWGSKDKFIKEFDARMSDLEDVARKADVPPAPRRDEMHNLLQSFIDEHYDTQDVKTTEYVSAKDVMDKLVEIDKKLDR